MAAEVPQTLEYRGGQLNDALVLEVNCLTNWKKRLEEACTVTMNERCSTVLLNKLPSKEKDPGSFTIPYDIGHLHINHALANLGASINLMPYTMYEKLGLGEPKPTRMSLELADRSIRYPRGIAENVLIKIDKFILPVDFVILDMREDSRILIILGIPFLATARAMIDVFNKKITLRVGNEEVIFDVDQSITRPPPKDNECYRIDYLDTTIHSKTQDLLEDDQLDSFLVNNREKSIDQSNLESCKADDGSETETPIQRIRKMQGINCLEDVRHKGNKSVILHIQDLNGGKLQACHSTPAMFKSESLRRGFFQIPIAPKDQDKTTFTCPYGTFAYRSMSFRLCNAPATFQKCMTAIFTMTLVGKMLWSFRGHFLVFGFNIEIKDKKGAENFIADYLSRLENPNMGELAKDEVTNKFPDEHLMILKANLNDEEPWYADYGNYIIVPRQCNEKMCGWKRNPRNLGALPFWSN
ncbi:DNA-directed DNA polymerase [Tanacetum coccineum]|uniref:DNA-directed DNA polymerase n=1 Tax=Tanacetum coccineum TaxID=301880 RepID=A0ABQ5J1R7_9ASTR